LRLLAELLRLRGRVVGLLLAIWSADFAAGLLPIGAVTSLDQIGWSLAARRHWWAAPW
jgi:hypothetical protein